MGPTAMLLKIRAQKLSVIDGCTASGTWHPTQTWYETLDLFLAILANVLPQRLWSHDSDDKDQDQSRDWPQNNNDDNHEDFEQQNPIEELFVATHPAPQFHLQAVQRWKCPGPTNQLPVKKKSSSSNFRKEFPMQIPWAEVPAPPNSSFFQTFQSRSYENSDDKVVIAACLKTATDPLLIGG